MKNKKRAETKAVAKEPDQTLARSVRVEKKNGSPQCTVRLSKEKFIKSTGCKDRDASEALIKYGLTAVTSSITDEETLNAQASGYLALVEELNPKDAFEGMLISQMSVTHVQALDCMRMAANNKEHSKIFERLQNQGVKLMRLYNYQLETLDKHRNKGRQKMTVEHVHVHKGGQAIVGEIHQGGGESTNEN